ncbi:MULTISPECIES: TonB-dependent receptor [unclassified Microbulbifer]|uniref:TonB-dependent receptor n=1 Tax=unclassified Microbulbifer TaxID=2619833 RepID=UPI0027E40A6D|nr:MULTISPECIES: TonB-dependent receptor [unclassified Microbulbifer]
MMREYFARNDLSAALGLAVASLVATTSNAQTETTNSGQAEVIEEISVTGMRSSLRQSLAIKQEASGVVDAVVAEDIGKFPDANVAESLQRIPGIYLSRDGSSNEGNRISIRGLGPSFAVTTINGAPVHTTSSDNIGSSTRDFNYDVFPSELFGAVRVYKTPMAELTEGGIGGVVDLATPRPHDQDGQVIRYAVSAPHNDSSEETSPRGSFLYSNIWGNFGALIGLAHSEAVNTRSGFQTTGSFNRSALGEDNEGAFGFKLDLDNPDANFNDLTRDQIDNAFMPRFYRTFATTNERERTALVNSFQFKNDKIDISLDTLLAEINDERDEYTFGAAIRNSGTTVGTGIVPIDPIIDEHNNLHGVFGNVPIFAESVVNDSETEFQSFNLRAEYLLTDTVTLRGQITSSSSDAELTRWRMGSETREGVEMLMDHRGNGLYPDLVILNGDITNPQFYTRADRDFSLRNEEDDDDMAKFEIAWDYDVRGWLGTLKSGVSYAESSKYSSRTNGSAVFDDQLLPNGLTWNTMTTEQRLAVMDSELSIDPFAKGSGENFPKGWANWTRDTIENFFQPERATRMSPRNFGATFEAQEDVASIYLQTDLRGDVYNRELRMNVGLRYSETDVSIDNFLLVDGEFESNSSKDSYENLMPSVSLAYDVYNDVVLRASYGKTITRSALTDIAGSLVIPNVFEPQANSGNPGLLPMEADQYDLTAEWYFAEGALVSVGLFQKDLSDTTTSETVVVPWSSLGLPDSALGSNLQDAEGNVDPDLPITLSTKVNEGDISFTGLEMAYQQNFTFLPGIWGNFGTQMSYTRVDTDGQDWTSRSGVDHEVWNVPKYGYAVTGFWEDEVFTARLSWTYKDRTAVETNNDPGRDLQRWRTGAGYLDASLSYHLTDWLEVRIDGTNLNDEKTYEYFPDPDGIYSGSRSRRDNFLENGRTITLGIRGSL